MRALADLKEASVRVAGGALSLLYPPRCALCETPLKEERSPRYVCPRCLSQVERVRPPVCARCGAPRGEGSDLCGSCAHRELPFERARSFGPYEAPLARLIQLLKFGRERALAAPLSELLARLAAEEGLLRQVEAITFVPMWARDRRARGFNQAELLARHLGRRVGVPVRGLLRKVQQTRPQVELTGRERLLNVKGAFAPRGPIPFETVLLVDDVTTTGATAAACSEALRQAGCAGVFVLTLARTLPRSGPAEVGEGGDCGG